MAFLARFLVSLPLLIVSPLVMAISAAALALSDLFGVARPGSSEAVKSRSAATVVIPNWNGRDLLARYLP